MRLRFQPGNAQRGSFDLCASSQAPTHIPIRQPRKRNRPHPAQGNLFPVSGNPAAPTRRPIISPALPASQS